MAPPRIDIACTCVSSVPISSAVSMPSREIISSVNRNTPTQAAVPVFSVDSRRWPSISLLIFFAVRHMCTVSDATDTAATMARMPSHNAWFDACWNRYAAPMLSSTDNADAPVHGGNQLAPAALAQIREADGDDEERLEPLAQRDHECLQHAEMPGVSGN